MGLTSSPSLPLNPRKRSLGGKHGTRSVFVVRLEMGIAGGVGGFLFFLILPSPQDLLVTKLLASAPGTAGEYICCRVQIGRVGREAMSVGTGGQIFPDGWLAWWAVKWKTGTICTLYFPPEWCYIPVLPWK